MKGIVRESCIIFLMILAISSCKKSPLSTDGSGNKTDSTGNNTDTLTAPTDPSTAASIGFFLDGWQPKTFTDPTNFKDTTAFSGTANDTVTVNMYHVVTKVSQYLFGNNTNIYLGQMVNEPTLLQYLTDLAPHVIRFPGGNLSSVYFWNARPGNPPSDAPDSLLDGSGNLQPAGYWYGQNTASWTLSVDNYYQMLQMTHNTGMITINYGYARYGTGPHPVQTAAHLAADWVRYDNGRTKFWEIGNESSGSWQAGYQIDITKNQDRQPAIQTGTLYGQHFKIFADSMRAAAQETGADIKIGAQLIGTAASAASDPVSQNWNSGYFSAAGNDADFYIVHDYYTPYNTNSSPAQILSTPVTETQSIMDYMNTSTQTNSVSMKPVALTEWNIFAVGSQQMVSDIAGVHAVMVLGELIKDKFGEASRWDIANGWDNGDDQGMFNAGDEPNAAKWNPRPAFYYMYYFQRFFGDKMVTSSVQGSSAIVCYASSFSSGQAGIILVNTGIYNEKVKINLQHFTLGSRYYWYTLVGGNDNGDFSRKVYVNGSGPSGVSGGPQDYANITAYSASTQNGVQVAMPPYSVVYLQVDNK